MSTKILDLPMGSNDANAHTVRDYLKALLKELWNEGEGFSGKRPFGNSGWEGELYYPLVKAGLVHGEIDGSYAECVDEDAANRLIFEAIEAL